MAVEAPFGVEGTVISMSPPTHGSAVPPRKAGLFHFKNNSFPPDAWVCVFKTIIAELKFETVILITNYSNNFEIGLNWLVMLHLPESFYGKVRNKKKNLAVSFVWVQLKGPTCNKQVGLGPLGQTPASWAGIDLVSTSPSSAHPGHSPVWPLCGLLQNEAPVRC